MAVAVANPLDISDTYTRLSNLTSGVTAIAAARLRGDPIS